MPKFHYELLACGFQGHRLIGTEAAQFRDEDALFARELDGIRWHRCVRCDSWLPMPAPDEPASQYPPSRAEISLPLRGKGLRDKFVLRVIAIDRAFHFVVLAVLAAAVFLLRANVTELHDAFYRVLADLQGGAGGASPEVQAGLLGEVSNLLSLRPGTLELVGAGFAAYAVLEGAEAVGLWLQKRWAEYLTFIATALLLPLEVYELSRSISPFKVSALIINLAILVYLLIAKRLFGVRGGADADVSDRERDSGWDSLERTAPERMTSTVS
jgi:uncharacterized membrane protein (DUF2068 family)